MEMMEMLWEYNAWIFTQTDRKSLGGINGGTDINATTFLGIYPVGQDD